MIQTYSNKVRILLL